MVEYRLNYYLVAIIDVLGQQVALAELTEMPTTPEERKRAAAILERTLGRVSAVRESFETFFEASNRDHPFLDTLPVEVAEVVRDVTKSEVRFTHFSDSTVLNVSLASDEGDLCLAASGVLDVLAAACFTQFAALAVGMAVRGGIEIGLGSPIGDREVYGPVLSRAHILESRVAGYPRIVAGDQLVKYLRGLAGHSPSSEREDAAVQHARRALSLLTVDEDGKVVTDFAGAQAREVWEFSGTRTPGEAEAQFKQVFDFVEGEYLRVRDSGDVKLAPRFFWLLRHLDSRSEHWTG